MNMVKLLLLLCLISGMSFFSEQSLADQNDPRLATLFLKLGNAETPQESKPFEKQIWQVWMEHESPEISTKLQEGTQAMQAQDFGKALVLFSELTEEAPGFSEGWNKRATVLYLMGRLQESVKDVEQTLNLEPRHFGALSGKGLILMALKDWSGAIEAFEQGLKVHPNMSSAQSHLQFLKKKQKEDMT